MPIPHENLIKMMAQACGSITNPRMEGITKAIRQAGGIDRMIQDVESFLVSKTVVEQQVVAEARKAEVGRTIAAGFKNDILLEVHKPPQGSTGFAIERTNPIDKSVTYWVGGFDWSDTGVVFAREESAQRVMKHLYLDGLKVVRV